MSCPLCLTKLSYDSIRLLTKACGACQSQVKQMIAGFRGVLTESRPRKQTWDNTEGYTAWLESLEVLEEEPVKLKKSTDYVEQRCDVRDMKRVVGLPKFLPLEQQVYTAWVTEGVKDGKIQEVLGLTYSQLFHVKYVIRKRLRKQMAQYQRVKALAKEH